MALATINKIQEKYYITNTQAGVITYDIQKLTDCVYFNTISSGTILPLDTIEVVLQGDGQYSIPIADTLITESILIKNYDQLLVSTIQSIYEILCPCGCGCSGCSDLDTEGCKGLLMTKAKIDTFKRLVTPQYVGVFDIIYAETKCLLDKQIYCSIVEEDVKGVATFNEKLMKQLIALDYLAIYFQELSSATTPAEIAYVKTKFKSDKVLCCITKLGIDVQKIEQLIKNKMGTITINSGSYMNQPPTAVGDNTISVTNRATTVFTLAMFTTATTPAYSDPENDPVDALRVDTLPVDGTLFLSGVPVTVGQIIPAASIVGGLFTHTAPNQDAIDTDTFNFSLRDTGSMTFVN